MRRNIVISYTLTLAILSCADFAVAHEDDHEKCETDSKHKEDPKERSGITYNIWGQERVRGDFVRNQNLGDFSYSPDTRSEQILSRTRLNLLLSSVKEVKAFVEGQFYFREDKGSYHKTSLYQAYVELSDIEHVPLALKIGRQELCYGSGFFLGTNDFYDGLVWDAAKARLSIGDRFWIDGIAARFVDLSKGTSNDRPAIYGAYSEYELAGDTDAALYFFYNHGGFQFFHTDLPDSPQWYTIGARLAGKIMEKFDYEIEPLYQFGEIDNPGREARDGISAYGGHLEAGYTFELKYNPRVFAGYAFGSGDNNAQNKIYREFHGNIYNDQYIVGDISLIPDLSGVTVGNFRASGMHIIIAGLSADLHPRLNLNVDYHQFIADRTPADISGDVGGEINLIVMYKPFKNLDIIASANRFFTGNFFEDAAGSGKDIDYFYVQAQIKF